MNTNIPNIHVYTMYIYLQQNRKYTVDFCTCIVTGCPGAPDSRKLPKERKQKL